MTISNMVITGRRMHSSGKFIMALVSAVRRGLGA